MEDIDDLIKDEEEETERTGGKPKIAPVEDMIHHCDSENEDSDSEEDDNAGSDDDDSENEPKGGGVLIGTVEHFFSKINVAAIRLTGILKVGDAIEARGDSETVRITVASMQIEKEDVAEADDGDSVGIKTEVPLSVGSKIYRVS